jgi:hypothetical protein
MLSRISNRWQVLRRQWIGKLSRAARIALGAVALGVLAVGGMGWLFFEGAHHFLSEAAVSEMTTSCER